MPGKQNKKASGNPLRPIMKMIEQLNAASKGRSKKDDDDDYDVMSDPFVRELEAISRDEVREANKPAPKDLPKKLPASKKAEALDKIRKKRKKLLEKGQKEGIQEAAGSFFKDVD